MTILSQIYLCIVKGMQVWTWCSFSLNGLLVMPLWFPLRVGLAYSFLLDAFTAKADFRWILLTLDFSSARSVALEGFYKQWLPVVCCTSAVQSHTLVHLPDFCSPHSSKKSNHQCSAYWERQAVFLCYLHASFWVCFMIAVQLEENGNVKKTK